MEESVEMVGGEVDVLRVGGLVESEGPGDIIILRAGVEGASKLRFRSVALQLGRENSMFHSPGAVSSASVTSSLFAACSAIFRRCQSEKLQVRLLEVKETGGSQGLTTEALVSGEPPAHVEEAGRGWLRGTRVSFWSTRAGVSRVRGLGQGIVNRSRLLAWGKRK